MGGLVGSPIVRPEIEPAHAELVEARTTLVRCLDKLGMSDLFLCKQDGGIQPAFTLPHAANARARAASWLTMGAG